MALEALPSGLKMIFSGDGLQEKVYDQECLAKGVPLCDGDLQVKIYYLECLAQATYVISHEGNAFIVDPRRDVDVFISELHANKLTLKGVLETHFHADFLSGHYELMQRTGATIYFGPGAAEKTNFSVHELKDNEVIDLSSRYAFKTLHTPGHTPESVVYLLVDKTEDNKPLKAFTGDTLFIGSCGRPDLLVSVGCTAAEMSKKLFNSLKNKLCALPDLVQVFPAHGAGSPCGKNLSKDLHSTIGKEKKTNPALQYSNEDEFVNFLTKDLPAPLPNGQCTVGLNREPTPLLAEELAKVPRVPPEEFKALADSGKYTIIDTRAVADFNPCHIVGSLNFPLGDAGGTIVGPEDGNFASWVSILCQKSAELLLVCDLGKEGETLQRLSRVGYTNVRAILSGGMSGYHDCGYPTASIDRLDLEAGPALDSCLTLGHQLADVRTEDEFKRNTAKTAINLPLAKLYSVMEDLDKEKEYITFCVSGYRSAIAASLLRKAGYKVKDIYRGFAAVSVYAPGHTTAGSVCPSMKALIGEMNSTDVAF